MKNERSSFATFRIERAAGESFLVDLRMLTGHHATLT